MLQFAALVVATLTLALGVTRFTRDQRRRARDRKFGTYDDLDEMYRAYLRLCIEHPEVDLFEVPHPDGNGAPRILTGDQRIKQLAVFDVHLSLLERAFLVHHDRGSLLEINRWRGWSRYIDQQFRNPTFRAIWDDHADGYDDDFMNFMNIRRGAAPEEPVLADRDG